MTSTKMSAAKGAAAGMVAGFAVGVGVKMLMDDGKRGLKKKASKVIDSVESLTDTVKYIFK